MHDDTSDPKLAHFSIPTHLADFSESEICLKIYGTSVIFLSKSNFFESSRSCLIRPSGPTKDGSIMARLGVFTVFSLNFLAKMKVVIDN